MVSFSLASSFNDTIFFPKEFEVRKSENVGKIKIPNLKLIIDNLLMSFCRSNGDKKNDRELRRKKMYKNISTSGEEEKK